jgi:hypothetical protein
VRIESVGKPLKGFIFSPQELRRNLTDANKNSNDGDFEPE